MKIEFKINKYYLVSHTIASKIKPFSAWEKLEDKLWGKYKNEPAYYFLNTKHINWTIEQIRWEFLNKRIEKTFQETSFRLEKIYKDIFKTKEFKKLYKETEEYLKFVKNEWDKNQKEVLNFISKISGIKISNKKVTVFITHPKLHNGRALTGKNIILWGHPEDWENYNTVYLCHELMHLLTWNCQKNPFLMHTIVELLTDNELRIKLNGSGKYFKENGFEIGHHELRKLSKKLLPYWKKYLKEKTHKNIFEFEKFLIKKRVVYPPSLPVNRPVPAH